MGGIERTSRVRTLRLLLYTFVLVASCMQLAVVPMLPGYAHHFGLSSFEQGLLLAATGIATLAVSLPAGALSDRLGARRVTLWAGELMAVAALIQALAPTFSVLILARLIFGVGYGVTWTAGLSWLAEGAPGESSLGGSVASAGIGGIIGPAIFGVLAEYFGLRVPFFGAAAVIVAITAALGFMRLPAASRTPRVAFGHNLRVIAADRTTIAATAAIVVAGISTGVAYLLAPEELHRAGGSAGTIGLAFSAAGILFVIGSVITAFYGRRAVRLSIAFAGMLAVALAISPAALSAAPFAVVGMLCATSAARAVVWTVSYPLGAAGAARTGAGFGVVMGLLNGVWAATAVVIPLVAGAVAEHLSARSVFALAELSCLAVLAVAVLFARHSRGAVMLRPLEVISPATTGSELS